MVAGTHASRRQFTGSKVLIQSSCRARALTIRSEKAQNSPLCLQSKPYYLPTSSIPKILSFHSFFNSIPEKMPEHGDNKAENLLNNIMESFADSSQKHKSVRFFDEGSSVSTQMNKLFGRQRPIHNILGGGKPADVLLWRNKKISSSGLVAATAVWVLFEWLNYHFLTIICFGLVIMMLLQFVWSNASGILNRSTSEVPKLVLADDLFVNIAVSIGAQINQFLGFIQDVACGRNLKQFIMVVAGLLAAAIIGSWCNFLTVLYIGYISAHTLPVVYEKYDDQIDDFIYQILGQLQNQYRKLDEGLLRKIPKGNLKSKKAD